MLKECFIHSDLAFEIGVGIQTIRTDKDGNQAVDRTTCGELSGGVVTGSIAAAGG